MKLRHPNRVNTRKHKGGCGCKLCKPHKGKWAPYFKAKFKSLIKSQDKHMEI